MAEADKVERVARALCRADGKDPDQNEWTGKIEPNGPEIITNWHRYRDEAQRFIAASEALAGTITSGG